MSKPSIPLTLGIEEEYWLVDPQTEALISCEPAGLMARMKTVLGEWVSPEFLQCQVEIATPKAYGVAEARELLVDSRRKVAAVAAEFDLAIIASSTHPFSLAEEQQITNHPRYETLAVDLQAVVRRLLISGMHVHIGVEDNDLRIELMNQGCYILPHLLALSTSSPFWRGQETGLKSYRMSVWDEMPRTGLPEIFTSYSDYQRHIDILVKAGVIEDSSKIWWDLRPSHKLPTLEMRIADLCTSVDDAICITALYASWINMLVRLRRSNTRWREYSRFLIDENRWRAHRYGNDEGLIDFSRGEIRAMPELMDEMLDLVAEDAVALNCEKEVAHVRTILSRGTSSDRQSQVFQQAMAEHGDKTRALRDVVAWLRQETIALT